MANHYRLKDISRLPVKPIFFDANILIYVFWPTGSSQGIPDYSPLFNLLLTQKKNLVVDTTVLSEFINSIMRFEWDRYLRSNNLNRNHNRYKKYRESDEGKDVLRDIYTIISKKILPHFDLIGKVFSKKEIHSLLMLDSLDFNDKVICSLCSEKDCILLTHDADFAHSDIDILSLNHLIS